MLKLEQQNEQFRKLLDLKQEIDFGVEGDKVHEGHNAKKKQLEEKKKEKIGKLVEENVLLQARNQSHLKLKA